MPKSKRNKVVPLTKVAKKDQKDSKTRVYKKIQEWVAKSKSVIVFQHENMTTAPLKDLQDGMKPHSKFFIGKNKVMGLALGKDELTSFKLDTYQLSSLLKGETGLLCTTKIGDEVVEFLQQHAVPEYAKPGTISKNTVVLSKGKDSVKRFNTAMEPYLRKLGLDTKIVDSEVELLEDFVAAEYGKPLTVEQAKILQLLELKLGEFRIKPIAIWNAPGGVKMLVSDKKKVI